MDLVWAWLHWAWTWSGWHRQSRVGRVEAAFKLLGVAVSAAFLAWVVLFLILVAGPFSGTPGWAWDVAIIVAGALVIAAVTWWAPRNPYFLVEWLQRRKRRARPRRTPKPPGTKLRGRPPRPSTVALRGQLQADHDAGQLGKAAHYVQWLLNQDPGLTVEQARTAVRREIKAYQ